MRLQEAQSSPNRKQPAGPKRRRWLRALFWAGASVLLLLSLALHVGAWLIGRHEQPQRLAATIHITELNGFKTLWVQKRATNGSATIVFIHGTPGRAGVWREQFAQPFPHADLIAYDRPGFGDSTPVARHPHLGQQVEALTNLLAAASITNRVLLVGHSYGGPIALLAAIEHPDLIAGVLLIGADVSPKLEKMAWFQYVGNVPIIEWLVPRKLRQCNREILAAPRDLLEIQNGLPNLSVPIVMLHGARDAFVPLENVTWLESQLRSCGKLHLFAKIVLPDADHFIPWERPQQVARGIAKLIGLTDQQSLRNGKNFIPQNRDHDISWENAACRGKKSPSS
jgi:pimeloyl-ACP methyl ester carboxylesterase